MVEHATRLIRDGQWIRVHGTEGYVEILAQPAQPNRRFRRVARRRGRVTSITPVEKQCSRGVTALFRGQS